MQVPIHKFKPMLFGQLLGINRRRAFLTLVHINGLALMQRISVHQSSNEEYTTFPARFGVVLLLVRCFIHLLRSDRYQYAIIRDHARL